MADAKSEEPPKPQTELGGDGGTRKRPHTAASRRLLAILFVYALVIWSVGNGLLPLLPKFASQLGADDLAIGIYLASSYAAIALGTVTAGWLADRLGHRRTQMVVVGLAASPIVIATSYVTAFWQVVAMTAAIWWLGGIALTLASILAGLSAGPGERGAVLGILALAAPTGSIVGGLGIGFLADALGFSAMWTVLGVMWLVCPAAGLLVHEVSAGPPAPVAKTIRASGMWTTAFLVLLFCGVLGAFGSFIGAFGRSLVMRATFSNEAITSTVAVSGLVTLPFPVVVGALSDRFGRLRFMALCYGAGIAGLLVYSVAGSLWEFWTASALVAFVSYVSTGVGYALVVDLVDRDSVGRGLAFFGATGWIGGILGFAAGGYLFTALGYADGFVVGASLVVVALLLLLPIGWAINSHRPKMTADVGRGVPRKD